MARFRTTIASSLAPREAFDRMAAFENVPEWDPATSACTRVGNQAGLGALYDVTTRFGGKVLVIRYTMSEFDSPTRFVLDASLPNGIGLRDVVTVEPDAGLGSLVTYDAEIRPRGLWRIADPVFQLVFARIGAKAVPELRRYLDAR